MPVVTTDMSNLAMKPHNIVYSDKKCPGSGKSPIELWGPFAGVCPECRRVWLVHNVV